MGKPPPWIQSAIQPERRSEAPTVQTASPTGKEWMRGELMILDVALAQAPNPRGIKTVKRKPYANFAADARVTPATGRPHESPTRKSSSLRAKVPRDSAIYIPALSESCWGRDA